MRNVRTPDPGTDPKAIRRMLKDCDVKAKSDIESVMLWGFRGEIHYDWPGPLDIKGLGVVPLVPTCMLENGDTLEYWLCIEAGKCRYEWWKRPALAVTVPPEER